MNPRLALRRARAFTGALGRSTSGLALTEFAFSLPILLTLGLSGMECANLAMAHLRVSNIAVITADNASRVRDSIDEADIVEVFSGAKRTGTSINFAQNGRITLSSLEVNGTTQWIRWQRCDGLLNVAPAYGRPRTAAGNNITDGTEIYQVNRTTPSGGNASSSTSSTVPATGMGPTGRQIAAASGSAVMMVEVVYTYQPIVPASFLTGIQIRYESGFNVRQRTNQSITNAGQITPKRCDQFAA